MLHLSLNLCFDDSDVCLLLDENCKIVSLSLLIWIWNERNRDMLTNQ